MQELVDKIAQGFWACFGDLDPSAGDGNMQELVDKIIHLDGYTNWSTFMQASGMDH